jgi:hypothetical protein
MDAFGPSAAIEGDDGGSSDGAPQQPLKRLSMRDTDAPRADSKARPAPHQLRRRNTRAIYWFGFWESYLSGLRE